jgi:hypothetical protein
LRRAERRNADTNRLADQVESEVGRIINLVSTPAWAQIHGQVTRFSDT